MDNEVKTKEQFMSELEEMRQWFAEFKKSEAERGREGNAIKEPAETLHLLYKEFPFAYQSLDQRGMFLEANQVWLDLFGYTREEVLGRWFGDFLTPDSREVFEKAFPCFKEAGETRGVEFEIVKKDGSIVVATFSGKIAYDERGHFKQTHCIIHDLTEQKQKERTLALENRRLSKLLDRLPGVVFMVAPDYSIRFANLYFRELFGEPGTKRCHEIIWGRKKPCRKCRAFRVFGEGGAFEWKWTSSSGRTYQLYNYPITDLNGSPLALELGVDITHQREKEAALRSSSEFRKKIIDSITDPLVIISPKTYQIVKANDPFFAWVGLEPDETLGKPCYEIMLGRDAPCYKHGMDCPVKKTALIKSSFHLDMNYCDAKGRERMLQVATYPLFDSEGEVEMVIELERDIIIPHHVEDVFLPQTALDEKPRLKPDPVVSERLSYDDIIGQSKIMQDIYDLIDLVAKSEATILITGENGTGKELVAQAIHRKGDRKDGPFIVANCSAYPPTLLESELFGHEKGAFTGAIRQKKGRIERANGGTLFLDEIGDIAPATQVLLLRFLQDRIFERIGGEETIVAHARVLAATNRNLYREVEARKFREDLYYRLNVISIHLPPLHKRKDDIYMLSKHFLEKYNLKEGKNIQKFSANVMKELERYSWPGNVRQLENAISHAVIVAQDRTIKREHLPRYLTDSPEGFVSDSLLENERRIILRVLNESKWNKHEAARRLNIGRSTLYSKIKRHSLRQG